MTGPESPYRVLVGGVEAVEPEPATNWTFTWTDRAAGVARLQAADRAVMVVVEGNGPEWFVTLRGRRIPVSVRNRREQLLADAASASGSASTACHTSAWRSPARGYPLRYDTPAPRTATGYSRRPCMHSRM